MATGAWPTLLDVTSRLDPQGKQATIAEMLSQANELDDAPYVEGNEIGGHEFTFRTSIPTGSWRAYYQGIPYAKSTTAKSRVGLGSLEDYSQVDKMLAEDSGDVAGFRQNEDIAFLEGMGQQIAQAMFYGNIVSNPAQFMGLAPFYNTVTAATAQNAGNVIDALGAGSSNTSLWLIGWSPRTIFMLFPRAGKGGLSMEDKGDTVPGYDSNGNRFEAYTSWFRQRAGLCPQDWRYGVRVANIDTTSASGGLAGDSPPDLFALMAQACYLPPALTKQTSGITRTDAPSEPAGGIRPVFYANRTLKHWMHVQGMRDRNVLLSIKDYAGMPVSGFNDIPVKVVDQLLNTEAQVV